jgi:hypothetical protein
MESNEKTFTKDQIPDENDTVDENIVKLQREWVIWENYDAKTGERLDYSKTLQKIFTFDDIVSFWQFWNNYPGSEPSYIFYNGERIRL